MTDPLDSNGSLELGCAVSTTPPRVDIEIAAWKPDAAFSSNDHVTYPTQSQHNPLLRTSPRASNNRKSGLDIPDGVSAYTQNDRGYAAAVEVFNSLWPSSDSIPKGTESDLKGIGSHLIYGNTNHIDTTVVTSMSLEVSNCLAYYAGKEDGLNWLPVTDLLRIFTRDSVLQALQEVFSHEESLDGTLQGYARKICPDSDSIRCVGSRSVFAILVHLGKVGEIREFVDRDLTDDNLPFAKQPGAKDPIGRLYPKGLPAGELAFWDFGSQWRPCDWTAFDTYQKKMRSPFFLLEDSRNRIPHYDLEAGTWLAAQCRGLAEGLQKIHRSPSEHATDFGIHGDIKPENILWFQNEKYPAGILVISDFGFTRFHDRDTRSNKPAVGYSPTHRAPEVDMDLHHPISRSYDIWALGCVFLEFITWYLTGPDGVKTTFVERRVRDDVGGYPIRFDKFFNIRVLGDGKKEAEVKSSVLKWIEELRNKQQCSQYFKDFLSFILDDMLSVNPKGRAKCDKVATELRILESSCVRNRTELSEGPNAFRAGSLSSTRTRHDQHQTPRLDVCPNSFTRCQGYDETWGSWSQRWSNPSEDKGKERESMTNIAAAFPVHVEGPYKPAQDDPMLGKNMRRTEKCAEDTDGTLPILVSARPHRQHQLQPSCQINGIMRAPMTALPDLGR
ncbi:hypothetical protein CSAL01_06613 [Colletotrichum salicis]|uniref:Protein kinase domain-containing protein n=1 Tax=Colletotrichum salicis TaxID=1209931 RepID=A0A135V8H5_9PEZI|nr:hypothetical protein CSAL01_06613 [Colletotrichum salicis]